MDNGRCDDTISEKEIFKTETGEEESLKLDCLIKLELEQSFGCNVCPSTFKKKKLLYLHKLRSHRDPVVCDICDKLYKSSKHLKHHKEFTHAAPNLRCTLCDKLFSRPWNLRGHLLMCGRMPRNKGNVPCQVCGKKFAHEKSLKGHLQKFHSFSQT